MEKNFWGRLYKNKISSLYTRLRILTLAIIIPFTILVIYLIITLINFCNSYNQIVSNINTATSYGIQFKNDIDYTMYRLIIGTMTFEELRELGEVQETSTTSLRDPYNLIEECRADFKTLEKSVTHSSNVKRTESIINMLDKLESIIKTVDANIVETGWYDENNRLLEEEIRPYTILIQKYVQEYVYYETSSLEEIRIELLRSEKITLIFVISLFIILVLIAFIVSERITKSVANPIKKLCEETAQIAKGDFTSETKINSIKEIQVLTSSFNDMKGKIGDLIEDITMEQNNLRIVELKLLQEQINPHFLYNTLDTIIWLAQGNKTEEVVSMVTDLSDFFRTVLSEGKDYITIEEEERHIRSYLSIQKVRYQDILEYDIHIDKELYQYYILKLTLQPIVENALYHGIKNQRGKGKITVRGFIEGDKIIFKIEDNGIGMKHDDLVELRNTVAGHESKIKRSFGLANVNERLKRNYGERSGISFESEFGKGMSVSVHILKKNLQIPKENLQIN